MSIHYGHLTYFLTLGRNDRRIRNIEKVVSKLEEGGFKYMLTGSVAMSFLFHPTNDERFGYSNIAS